MTDRSPPEPYRQRGLSATDYRCQARHFQGLSRHLLAAGRLSDASEYGWAAAVWMAKAVAETQGWRYHSGDEIFDVMRRAQQLAGDDKVSALRPHIGVLLDYSGRRRRFLHAEEIAYHFQKVATLLDILEPMTETDATL